MSLRDMFNSYSSKDHPSRCLVTVEVWEVQQVGDTYIYEKSFLAVLHPMHLPPQVSFEEAVCAKGTKFGKPAVITSSLLCKIELATL